MSWPKRSLPLRKIVIADAGPLIAFARINQLCLLTQVFEGILVTDEVFNECTMRTDFPETKVICEAFHNKQLQRCDTPTLHFELALCVDVGEASAIAVALEMGYGVLMDDKAGRRMAKNLGIATIGTVGVLVLAIVLVDTIATTLQKPLGSAFTKEVIVVQRWLSMELELSSHRSIVTMV